MPAMVNPVFGIASLMKATPSKGMPPGAAPLLTERMVDGAERGARPHHTTGACQRAKTSKKRVSRLSGTINPPATATMSGAGLASIVDGTYWNPIQSGLDGETDGQVADGLAQLPAERIIPEAPRLAFYRQDVFDGRYQC
ncbi:hypothetical protein [Mesorhizobium sp. B4-1-4]|uniref:hypothetical protein n=1 Tax=Mesorhizobium sp. B4-1-4 TaxID=2589888 RepID=UPI00112AB3E5|nr:hypothetical protein [Mesorhizobium sp. B4-1-4]UCI31942.1 hypothetical protein FJW03_00190 [Mesorhizobium sp. B4-1-4]